MPDGCSWLPPDDGRDYIFIPMQGWTPIDEVPEITGWYGAFDIEGVVESHTAFNAVFGLTSQTPLPRNEKGRSMTIAFYGLGKLGLPYAALLADKGHEVVGIDVNKDVRQTVHDGHVPDSIREPGLPELVKRVIHHRGRQGHEGGRLIIPLGAPDGAAKGAEASIILVPTPSLPDGSFSIEYVLSAIRTIGRLIKGQTELHTVLLVSTVSPGSTGGPIRRALECASDRAVLMFLDLVYMPEFVQLGNVLEGMKKPFAYLMGVRAPMDTPAYSPFVIGDAPIVTMSWEEAELAKIGLNCALSLKPVLANTLAPICNHYGADVDRVTEFIGLDPRVGPKFLRAGLHPGGPCLPRDIRALLAAGEDTQTIALASSIDTLGKWETHRWYAFLTKLARRHFGWDSPRDVGVLGETYKPGVLVREEAFGTKLWQTLYGHDCLMIPSCDSTRMSNGEVGNTIHAAAIIVLTLMDPALKKVLECWPDLKNKVIVDPWRYLDRDKLYCLAYYGGLE